MKLRQKFTLMIAIPIIAIGGVFGVGIYNFINIRSLVQNIILLEGDRISISEADRDSYQALVAELRSVNSASLEEAETYKLDFEENIQQTLDRVVTAEPRYTNEMKSVLNDFRDDYNTWTENSGEIIQRALNVAGGNARSVVAEQQAIESFNSVRNLIDELGELINNELELSLSLQRRLNVENALSLVLNGDRDFYQAYTAVLLLDKAATRRSL